MWPNMGGIPVIGFSLASLVSSFLCALIATLVLTMVGAGVGRHVLPRSLVWPAAPALGWAIHSASALPVFLLIGFSRGSAATLLALSLVVGLILLRRAAAGDPDRGDRSARLRFLLPACLAAAVLALVPAVAVAPHPAEGGIHLSAPAFDHAKVAMVDAMTRLGLPPVNPFFAEGGVPGRLAYYYLWHLTAAEIGIVVGASGWEADIALTWFTAFASLTLLAGLAAWFGRPAAALWAIALAATASLRDVLASTLGLDRLHDLLAPPTGFAGWLFQSAWVPQHFASASCVLIAVLLVARLPARGGWPATAALALVVAAAFGSSTWIGGVAFVAAMLVACPVLLWEAEPNARVRLVLMLAVAAVAAVALTAPLWLDQLAGVEARGGAPLAIHPMPVLGPAFGALRSMLDLPSYWLILLPVEFPAFFVSGVLALGWLLRGGRLDSERRRDAIAYATLVAACLCVAWLGVSTLGDNNDLALRAALPAVFALIVFAGAGLSLWIAASMRLAAGAAIMALALPLPESAKIIYYNVHRQADAPVMPDDTAAMWGAVRSHSGPEERVANNPLFLRDLTPWPVNISWALLANRSSCFAGHELALAYTALPATKRSEIEARFKRVFDGGAAPDDVRELVDRYGCRVALVTAQDGAWARDPFAASPAYRLVEERPDRWRIYRATDVRSR